MVVVGRVVSVLLVGVLSGCASLDCRHSIFVSVADQKMVVTRDARPIAAYPVSTSKFGLGSEAGSSATPLGRHRVAEKIGENMPLGAVFKSRRFTGEVLPPDSSGRDPIVTRILWLDGVEVGNRSSRSRHIYIHGTPEEGKIGMPASYGCVRMRSEDVVELFDTVGVGAMVEIFQSPLLPRFPSLAPRI